MELIDGLTRLTTAEPIPLPIEYVSLFGWMGGLYKEIGSIISQQIIKVYHLNVNILSLMSLTKKIIIYSTCIVDV